MGWEEMVTKGGPVVFILIGYSLVALTIAIERLMFFLFLPRPAKDFGHQVQEALPVGRTERISGDSRCPEVAVVKGMIAAANYGARDLSQVASRCGSEELSRMERGFRTLGMLGNTAPLLGLFGTITGMIKAFQVIEQAGGRVDAQALAGGIWEAMITTGVGLAVAIPILLLLHILEGLADRRSRSMRYYGSLVLERWQIGTDEGGEESIPKSQGVLINAF